MRLGGGSEMHDLAIVGAGGIAEVHAQAVQETGSRARIVAVVDPDPARAAAFARRWVVPRTYASLGDLLAVERPELVHLCTPPGTHRALAVEALAAGVNVWCEKPPALSLAALDEIAASEVAGGARFATVFQHRFGSGARRLRALTQCNALGRLMVAECRTLWYRPDSYFEPAWRGRWETEGGGPRMGHGIHQIDLLLSILGPWREVSAFAARRARPTATEDLSVALVTFPEGAVATVVNSLVSPRQASSLRFDFDFATVELHHLYGYEDDDWTVTALEGHEDEVARAWSDAGPAGVPSGHLAQLTAVLDALDAGAPPPVTSADARLTLELVAGIYASAFTVRPVRRDELMDTPYYKAMDGGGVVWTDEGEPRRGQM